MGRGEVASEWGKGVIAQIGGWGTVSKRGQESEQVRSWGDLRLRVG